MTNTMTLTELIEECLLDGWAEEYTEHTAAKLMANHLIANGVTDNNVGNKWIPVTERLSEEGRKVLVCSAKGTILIAHYNHYWKSWSVFSSVQVTHWMPLPQPPKGVE